MLTLMGKTAPFSAWGHKGLLHEERRLGEWLGGAGSGDLLPEQSWEEGGFLIPARKAFLCSSLMHTHTCSQICPHLWYPGSLPGK